MKKFLFATFMGALVALAGCQQDDELTGVENTLGKKVSVTANIKANAQSRVAMEYVTGADGGSTIKVDWKESGEEFLMCDANNRTLPPTTFIQTSGNQFEGTLPNGSGTYIAVYGDYLNLVNQDGTLNEDYVWMTTEQLTDLTQPIQFEHKTTVLKPTFTLNGKNINATISKIVMGGVFIPGAEAITITPSQVNDIFIFLPVMMGEAIEAETLFTFTVTKDGKEYVAELSIGKSMIAGQFYTADIHLEEVIPYVTFTASAEQGLKYTGTDLQYSLDGTTFVDLEADAEIKFSEDGKLYLRNKGEENLDGTKYSSTYYKHDGTISFTEETSVACEGDIRTLIDYDNYENVNTSNATFTSLFNGCIQLKSAPELPATDLAEFCYQNMFEGCISLASAPVLPATTLAKSCYYGMFQGCVQLTSAPELPATTLEQGCYYEMFEGCTSLVTAPALPAETLAQSCYYEMFRGCTSLQTAPARLPATTLAQSCYYAMFDGCTSLKVAPALPAETLAESCYSWMFQGCSLTEAPVLPATALAKGCYLGMFNSCEKLETAPERLPATNLAQDCYSQMFESCKALETAPALPATTLAEGCYFQMFKGCEKLNKITMLATNISASNCLTDWVKDVPATGGTFIMNADATYTPSEIGIPTSWSIDNP